MSQDPVTRPAAISGDLTMSFLTLDPGSPVISAKNVEEKSINGEMEVTAALTRLRVQSFRFTYTHQTKERICPLSAGV